MARNFELKYLGTDSGKGSLISNEELGAGLGL